MTNNDLHYTKSVIIALDYDTVTDTAILLVGSKQPGKDVQVINSFEGETALDIWTKIYPDDKIAE